MSELTPYLCVEDSRAAIDWYVKVLGAEVTVEPYVMEDGRIGHAEVSIGGARVMMADPHPELNVEPPDPGRGNAVTLHLAVPDCVAVATLAADNGARLDRGPEQTDHGHLAVFRDPFGHRWMINS